MVSAVVIVIGLCIGSFLNVCIRRLPLEESIVLPPSHCPGCKTPIRVYDNIPILSFLLLRGRCRDCGERISWRYPLVEALTAGLLWLLYATHGAGPQLVIYGAFVAALVVITFIDIDYQIIPDAISLPGIPIGIAVAALGYGPDLRDSLIGVLIGGGILYAVAVGYLTLTGREGMGGGDIKLLAMIGAFLGWHGTLVTLMVGSFAGSVFGIALMVFSGADSKVPFAFGPFLTVGALIALFWGESILTWYLGLAGA